MRGMAPPQCFKKNQRFWSQFEEAVQLFTVG
jgi:hypothetical protein